MAYVAEKKGDTHTIAIFTGNWLTNPLIRAEAKFTVKDMLPVARLVLEPAVIAVKADSPFKTLKEFIDAAKKAPGTLKQSGGSQTSRDNVVRLFPNEIEKNNFIRNAVRLPSASAEKNYSFELEWLAPAGEDKDSMSEWVIVVATKKPMPWLAVYDMQRFKEKLLEIPADQRRVVHRPYVLMR